MSLHGRHLLGSDRLAEGDTGYQAVDPSSGEALSPSYTEASEGECRRALDLAAAAHPAFEAAGRECRAELLDAIAGEIEALGDTLVERAVAETGLPAGRINGERGRTTGQLRRFAGVVRAGHYLDCRIDPAMPDRTPLPRADLRRMGRAIGPVVVFGASNFPLAFSVAGGDTAAALAAGCPVVVKAHPAHPGTSELVGEAIARAVEARGLPPGVFSLVHGQSNEVGAALVRDPRTRAVAFTGSLAGGRALFDLAASRPEPIEVFAEMGSQNPVFFLPGALAEDPLAAAQGLCGSLCLGVGQFCTNPGLVAYVEGEGSEAFVDGLESAVEATAPGVMLHAGIAEAYARGREALAAVEGVEPLAFGQPAQEGAHARAQAAVFTCDVPTFVANPSLREEVFGPCTLIVRAKSAAELVEVARALEGQLTATLHANAGDLAGAGELLEELERRVGRMIFGGYPTGVEVCDAMQHGGPYPATTAPGTTSVGTAAISRFVRPVCYQNAPQDVLPPELRDENPDRISRLIDGQPSRESL